MMTVQRRNLTRFGMRRGAALVEMAICVPLIVVIAFGAIEATNAIFLQQALTEAAHEGARTATSIGKTEEDARTRIEQILTAQAIHGAEVSIEPPISFDTPVGQIVTVTVSAPANNNSVGIQWYFKDAPLKGTVVMMRQ
ncbi:MAG: pilus assembly protein [Planctomycetaceae bacterium]|nr:pilus assembly protein [Planctomycetaceae bacterium]